MQQRLNEPTVVQLKQLGEHLVRAEFLVGDKLLFCCEDPTAEDIVFDAHRIIREIAALKVKVGTYRANRAASEARLGVPPFYAKHPEFDASPLPLGESGLELTHPVACGGSSQAADEWAPTWEGR